MALTKDQVRGFLRDFKDHADETEMVADDMVYNALRWLAHSKGWLDREGPDDPGPRLLGGGDGGP